MGFQKGHKVKGGGRKKGTKNGEGKKSNEVMNTYNYGSKKWKKKSSYYTFGLDEVDYYLYNDLDITELMDKKKLPANEWKDGKGYNINKNKKNNGDQDM